MTHNERVLALLADGKPHTHHEIYALHVVGHSRIASLRAKGHTIESWRDGDDYCYRLVALREAAPLSPLPPGAASRSASQPCPPFPLGEEGPSAGARSPFGGSEPQATAACTPVVSPPGSEAGSESPNTLFDVDERKAPAWA